MRAPEVFPWEQILVFEFGKQWHVMPLFNFRAFLAWCFFFFFPE